MTGQDSSRRAWLVVCLGLIAVLVGERAALAQKKLGIFGSGDTKYNTYRDAAGRFEIEQPAKDWALVPAAGSSIAIISRNDRRRRDHHQRADRDRHAQGTTAERERLHLGSDRVQERQGCIDPVLAGRRDGRTEGNTLPDRRRSQPVPPRRRRPVRISSEVRTDPDAHDPVVQGPSRPGGDEELSA
jgi:hypothetical protein